MSTRRALGSLCSLSFDAQENLVTPDEPDPCLHEALSTSSGLPHDVLVK